MKPMRPDFPAGFPPEKRVLQQTQSKDTTDTMIIHADNYRTTVIGPKAGNLFLLAEAGYRVPPFFCVDASFSEQEVLAHLAAAFPGVSAFSVRSCASLEDGADCSFAGQFRTFLRVPREEVCRRIRDVFSDGTRPEHLTYFRAHGLLPSALRMHVIIQEMVEPDLSGILFTANPQGLLNESVIVFGRGSGDKIVEDKTDATTCYYNLTDRVYYYEQTGGSPPPTNDLVTELITASEKIKKLFGCECDMEFAIKEGTLFLLQVRPVTALDQDAPVIVLDNSNIVESYPGITLPLTQSFIGEAYYQVFRNLLIHLTGEPGTVERIQETLRHMVDVANGRIYYRINNWYDVLLFLPFCDRLIPIWQDMMGVKVKTVTSALRGKIRRNTRLKVAVSFFRLLVTCPREMEKLDGYFAEIIKRFESLDTDAKDNLSLLCRYRELQDMTAQRWDMTLVNDMYGFLFTGLLKARLKARHVPNPELAANRAISGIKKLESMRPIQELQKLASQAKEEGLLAELEALDTNSACRLYLEEHPGAFSRSLRQYIETYGDRNVEELKLESKTFRTDPILLVRCILQYAKMPACRDDAAPAQDKDIPLTGLLAFLAGKAAVGIRNREKSRLHRARLYGMMRTFALQMGRNLFAQDRIADPDDIFWLYFPEIEQACADPSLDLFKTVAARKKEYDGFSTLPAYSRLVFSGKVTDKHPKRSQAMQYESGTGVFAGCACSFGVAEGEVLLVDHPSPTLDARDKILVTKMTDPGWVFLIAPARAIVSEKGSVLSHTAIISRELKKPSVVGIEHITEYLKTGDIIRVDGNTGVVTVLAAGR